ncbi:MAG: septation regulator SpoVG [Candidatus Babeliaceae bacterium]|nr:septation regulator SpoVG [Candidatus Babeliaceae bacterium]
MMKITEVKVYPATGSGRLKAYATIVFDGCFIVRDLKVIEGREGLFVSMPSRRRKDGTFRDIVHPLNSEMRTVIEERIISEYRKVAESVAAGSWTGPQVESDEDVVEE